jgi:hypothetical protein
MGRESQLALVRGAHLILQLPSAAPRLPTQTHISGTEKAFKGPRAGTVKRAKWRIAVEWEESKAAKIQEVA